MLFDKYCLVLCKRPSDLGSSVNQEAAGSRSKVSHLLEASYGHKSKTRAADREKKKYPMRKRKKIDDRATIWLTNFAD